MYDLVGCRPTMWLLSFSNIYICIFIYIDLYIRVRVYIYVCMCICMYTYKCMHIDSGPEMISPAPDLSGTAASRATNH